jgi:hypothetical protein
MTATVSISGATDYALQSAISAYTEEKYTTQRRLSDTGIVSSPGEIDVNAETFLGQLRWKKPLNPTINVASLTDATAGTTTSQSSAFLRYIKTVRTHGGSKVNLKDIISQEDGIAQFSADLAITQANDENNALMAVLKGIAVAEALNGAATGSGSTGLGGQTFSNDPTDGRYGFYVDLGAAKPVVDATTSIQGAARAEGFLNAIGMAWKDYEPEYLYLATSPEVMASLRSANLVDSTRVTEGMVDFQTIFDGKIRLLPTRASQAFSSAQLTKINTGAGVDIVGAKTSFLMLPGTVAFKRIPIPNNVEIQRDAKAYKGGGTTAIWFRWGYILHPAGYDWAGAQDAFPSDADYYNSVTGGTPEVLTAATVGVTTTGTWLRKAYSALSLGILPVFHS